MFRNAIVRTPGRSMVNGLSTTNLGFPDYAKALRQHQAYIETLQSCGLEVTVLDADEGYPDSTFVEDTALLTPHCAIIMNPGAASRRGEILSMEPVISGFYANVERVIDPGTADAGDIMMVGDHYYIGLSERTNAEGARQVIAILQRYGMSGSTIRLATMLHLKTGLAYLENGNLVVCDEFAGHPDFQRFNKIAVPAEESYAANCIWINGRVILPAGFPRMHQKISALGYPVMECDMSEFQKLDGGLSCLSLRF